VFNKDLFGDDDKPEKQGAELSNTWEYPPFSVLNAREGWWQERKRQWLALGIKSEVGRDIDPTCVPKNAPDYMAGRGNNDGGSIFDPTLCELLYRWFCPPGGSILDPFAGGSVRGIVASYLARQYHGVELREDQVMANLSQHDISRYPTPHWYMGDSQHITEICAHVSADFVFSCPPYANLEVYSDNPVDLSNMDYPNFLEAYRAIIAASCSLLKEDRFACFVVGDVRDKKGNYRNFVGDTVEAFRATGLHYYNEAILVTAVGSLPIRVNKQFKSGRKLGKTHQNILVFVKGDGKKAAEACNP
jgi:DNA modification methylase